MREREEIKHIFQALPAQFRMFYFFSQEGMYKYFLSQSLKVAPWPSWTLYYLLQVGTTTALEVLNVLLKLMHLLEEAAELFGKIRKKKILTQEYYGQKLQLTQKLFKDFFPSFFHHVWTRPTYYEYECITYYYTLQSAHTYIQYTILYYCYATFVNYKKQNYRIK